jgi:FkbM family methyltransferase
MKGQIVRLAMAPGRIAHFVDEDPMHQSIAATGCYDYDLSERLGSLAVESGGLMIDVGSNIGYFSILWASRRMDNRVLAFEPSPRNISLLKGNIDVNPALRDRMDLRTVALGKQDGHLAFDLGPTEQSGWGGFASVPNSSSVIVRVQRLDELIADNEVVSVLKIDCEGADAWVLAGAAKLLKEARIRHVFFEVNLQRQRALGIADHFAHDLLREYDYQVECITQDECEFHAWIN